MMRRYIYGFVLIAVMLSSCTKDDWLGVIIGQQPNFYDEDYYNKQLNVFVLLRDDGAGGLSKTVFEVSRTRMAVGDTLSDEELLWGSEISFYKLDGEVPVDSARYGWYRKDSVTVSGMPVAAGEFVEAGREYTLEVSQEGFETVSGFTVFPSAPEIAGSVEANGNTFTFRLVNDPSIFLYEVFLVYGDQPGPGTRVEKNYDGEYTNATVENAIPGYQPTHIMVYGYDENLTTYYSYSNVFIKPNTYRPPFTTVEGGYGCFGSVSELKVPLD